MSDAHRRRPILVTGAPRSGTTWVGRMLAEAPGVVYVHEPFNPEHPPHPGVSRVRIRRWFAYVTAENEAEVYSSLRNTVGLRCDLPAALRAVRSPADLRRIVHDLRRFRASRREGAVVLLKDPLAVFSTAWLASRFDMRVVVMVRHPAAYASSFLRLGWRHPFADFLAQPLLMRDLLAPFEAEIRDHAASPRPPLDQAILLWRLIYATVRRFRTEHPEWTFLRHEDVARDPLPAFERLYGALGLVLTDTVRTRIAQFSSPANPAEAAIPIGARQSLMLHSAASVENWKRRLTADQIETVRIGTRDVAAAFYGDADW